MKKRSKYTGVYAVTNPKTGDVYRAVVVEEKGAGYVSARVQITPEQARYGTYVGRASIHGGPLVTHLAIDAFVQEPVRDSGAGAALYLVAAVAAGDLGWQGIRSQRGGMRSGSAGRLWDKFYTHGLARHERDEHGRTLDILDAHKAWETGLIRRLPKLR